jgi:hypothetical protein
MSHRTALLVSLALTVLVGFAIVANRDRLLGASPAEPTTSSAATATTTAVDAALQLVGERRDVSTQRTPRIIEVTLDADQSSALASRQSSQDDRDDDDRYEDDDDDWDDHDEDDDDDDHEHDDDD